jgi:hypothetical protein
MVKKTIAGVAAAFIAGGLLGNLAFPNEKIVEKEVLVNQTVFVPQETIVEKEVIVDSGNLDLVLDHIYDNNGNVRYITNDLDDDEVDKIVDRIVLTNEFKKLAVDAVSAELVYELHNEGFDGETFDKDDIELIRIDDEADEVEFSYVDFEDEDARVKVTGRFDQDDVKYEFVATVEFKYGEYDEISSVRVSYY